MAQMELDAGLRTLTSRTRLAVYSIFAVIGTTGIGLLIDSAQMAELISIETSTDSASQIAMAFYLAMLIALIVSYVLVGMWIYRAHDNLRAANLEGLEFTPGWAVGWFAVPIATLFKPFQAMRELWNRSHGSRDNFAGTTDPHLGLWWGGWLAGNLLGQIEGRIQLGQFGNGEGGTQVAIILALLGNLATLVSAWYLLRIVRSVDEAQHSIAGLTEVFT